MRFISALLVCSAVFAAQPAPKSAFDKQVFEDYVRHLLAVMNSEVKVQVDDPKPSSVPGMKEVDVHLTYGAAAQDMTFYVTNDGKHILRGDIFDVNQSPFHGALSKLTTENTAAYGAPAPAPVTIFVFSDFECPLCKDEALNLHKNILADFPDKVRLYFKDFPLSSIHPWASVAAVTGRCVLRQSPAAFWDYHDWVYEHQGDITAENFTAKVGEFVKSKNLDQVQLGNCLQNHQDAEQEVTREVTEGRSLNIDKTPTMFVNGRKLEGNIPWENMKMLINYEIDYQKSHPAPAAAASSANEKCCEVSIPTAVGK